MLRVEKMKIKILLGVLLVAAFLIGCTSQGSNYNAYAGYNGQQPQPQGQVGGGCGVAPQVDYESTPVGNFEQSSSL